MLIGGGGGGWRRFRGLLHIPPRRRIISIDAPISASAGMKAPKSTFTKCSDVGRRFCVGETRQNIIRVSHRHQSDALQKLLFNNTRLAELR